MRVLERLAALFTEGGAPDDVPSDNRSGFTARAVRNWLNRVGVEAPFIELGSPWENAYVESFNRKFRDECLNGETFDTVLEAKVLIERWRMECIQVQPHSALNYRVPVPEAMLLFLPGSAPLPTGGTVHGLTLNVVQGRGASHPGSARRPP